MTHHAKNEATGTDPTTKITIREDSPLDSEMFCNIFKTVEILVVTRDISKRKHAQWVLGLHQEFKVAGLT